jgi:hypothetical protein
VAPNSAAGSVAGISGKSLALEVARLKIEAALLPGGWGSFLGHYEFSSNDVGKTMLFEAMTGVCTYHKHGDGWMVH